MAEIDELYQGRILELAANSPTPKRLAHPHATAEAYSKLCGSRITVDLCMEGEVITAYGHDLKACLLGQTAAAVVAANIVGSTAGEFRDVARQMRQMLKEGGEPPSGKWGDLALLESVRGYRARHGSTLLVFDAVEDALSQIERCRQG
jgi:NifU-like protein involved in Fe-S cluster formation